MFKELAEDFYEDENGSFCAIAERVKRPKALAKETGLSRIIKDSETVVIINRNLVNTFKQVELRQRLDLNFNTSSYCVIDSYIPVADGNYLIAAEPLKQEEVKRGGISYKVGSGRIAVRFQKFYRSNVAQNEINSALKQSMEEKRDSYESELVREFCDSILN